MLQILNALSFTRLLKIFLVLVSLLGFCITTSAQKESISVPFKRNMYLQPNIGVSQYFGELNQPDYWSHTPKFAFGGTFGSQFSPILGIRLQFMKTNLYSERADYNQNLSSSLWDGSVNFTININEIFAEYNPNRKLNFYLFTGPGITSYQSKIVNNTTDAIVKENTSRQRTFSLPLGAGAAIRLNNSFSINLEYCDRTVFDGLKLDFKNFKNKNDHYSYASAGLQINFGFKKEIKPVVVEAFKPVVKEEIKPVAQQEVPVAAKESEKVETVKKEAVIVIPPAEVTNKVNEDHKFFIQAGAFIKQKNAERLVKDLSLLTSQKWFIDKEDGFFKVRLGYFKSREAANKVKESLNTTDISYYISEIPFNATPERQPKETEIAQHKQAEVKEIKQTEAINAKTATTPAMDCEDSLHKLNGYFVQAGAFDIKSKAEKLVVKLTASTGKNWFIACSKGLYKVRLGYFATKKEANDLAKTLRTTVISLYVNKPEGQKIKQQPNKVTETEQNAKPMSAPAVKERKATKQAIPKPEKAEVIPSGIKNKFPEPGKEEEKVIKKTKEVMVPPADNPGKAGVPGKYYIQAGAFHSKAHAERLSQDLLGLTLKRWFIIYEDGLYKVRLGYFTTKEAAKAIEGSLNTTEVPYYIDGLPIEQTPGQ